MSSHTYTHRFASGLVATAKLSSEPPSFDVEWSGPPDQFVVAEYFSWRRTVIEDFARRTGVRVLVLDLSAFPTGNEFPGKPGDSQP